MNTQQISNSTGQQSNEETYLRSYLLIPICAVIALVLLPFIA